LVLPAGVIRDLSDEEMAEYRRSFADPGEDRRPTLTWPRQQPFDGEPAEVVEIVKDCAEWIAQTEIPMLFVNGDPGLVLTGAPREFCRSWPNQTKVSVPGLHYLQEDSPDLIGQALSRWLGHVESNVTPGAEKGLCKPAPSAGHEPGRRSVDAAAAGRIHPRGALSPERAATASSGRANASLDPGHPATVDLKRASLRLAQLG
jgi:hypothetical protein